MSFAVRPIGLVKGARWDFVGAGTLSTSSTVNFPATAQAGDLAVFCASVSRSDGPPSGWTLLASGSTLQGYLVCAGGETSATWTRSSPSNACILLFRPVGGAATLYASATENPTANRSMSAGASPSLIAAIGNNNNESPVTWSPTLPGSWSVVQNIGTASAFYVAWRLMDAGESTGTMNLGSSARQTFGIWSIT